MTELIAQSCLFRIQRQKNLRFPFAQNEASGKVDYYDEEGKALKISFS